MKNKIYARISELKEYIEVVEQEYIDNSMDLDPEIQDVLNLIRDEILFLKSIIRDMETH